MVKEHEWLEMGATVYAHFDIISGISFLPFDGGIYKQAPYEAITEEQYKELEEKMPKTVNWEEFIENTDNVEGAQQLACVAGYCEI
jgi:ribonucleoside-diphosphate reductase alpha chain